jgi:hypothetical protein
MFKSCSHGTRLHFSLQGSHLNICYYHQDLHRRRLRPVSRPLAFRATAATLLLLSTGSVGTGPGMGRSVERQEFSALVDSAGELLHTPWRFPTSMATVLLSVSTNSLYGV